MPNLPRQLDYAPPASNAGRHVRRALIVGLFTFVSISIYKWSGPAFRHLQLLYYQGLCQRNAPPTDRVVEDSRPNARPAPVPEWERFYSLFSAPAPLPVLFVGELQKKDGSPRLVTVRGESTPMGELKYSIYSFDTCVVEPATLLKLPTARSYESWVTPFFIRWATSAGTRPAAPLRLFAGQRDPNNPAHFTIAFEYAGTKGLVDGWLKDDDGVLFELRDPIPAGADH